MLVSGRVGNFACHFTFLHSPPTSLDTLSCPRYATISASLRNMLAASTALSTKIPHTLAVGPYKSTPTRSKVTGNDTKARPEGRRFLHQIIMDLPDTHLAQSPVPNMNGRRIILTFHDPPQTETYKSNVCRCDPPVVPPAVKISVRTYRPGISVPSFGRTAR